MTHNTTAAVGGYADTQTLELKIEGTPNAIKVLTNLLGAIQYNTGVGHSCIMGAFFDGDGADKISIEGLPENSGKDMADACSNWGDGLFAEIGANTAIAHNARYLNDEEQILVRTKVWPPEKEETTAASFLARAKAQNQ